LRVPGRELAVLEDGVDTSLITPYAIAMGHATVAVAAVAVAAAAAVVVAAVHLQRSGRRAAGHDGCELIVWAAGKRRKTAHTRIAKLMNECCCFCWVDV
jgi:hypothetical protein